MIKKLTFLFALLSACGLMAQPQPILRNAMTTNVAGTPVISQNNLSITNSAAGSTTNWLFYGTAPNTVARLVDIALGAGTLWATLVSNVDGSVTISTNATVTGTNIYGLSVTNYVLFTSNALQSIANGTFISNLNGFGTNVTLKTNAPSDFAAHVIGTLTNAGNLIVSGNIVLDGAILNANNLTSVVLNAQWNGISNGLFGSFVAGGYSSGSNYIGGQYANYATIGGGFDHQNWSQAGTISGGGHNWIGTNAAHGTIAGGSMNTISNGTYNVISGGRTNSITNGTASVISGGDGNRINTGVGYSTIGGGYTNQIIISSGQSATIGGGQNNLVEANYSTIAGGVGNTIAPTEGTYGTVGGGAWNWLYGDFSTIIGGRENTNSTGDYSVILGGYSNRTEGSFAVAAGRNSQATAQGAWMISDSIGTNKINSTANSLYAKFAGGFRFEGGNLSLSGGSYYGSGSGFTNLVGLSTVKAGTSVTITTNTVNGTNEYTINSTASGSGAPWATIVSNADDTITIYTNATVTGTNIYGLAVADPLNLTELDVTTLSLTNVIGYLNATNMAPTNGVEGQVLTVTLGTGGTNMYWKTLATGGDVTTAQLNSASNAIELHMTNLNVATSNALQQSMSNTVDYVSNILESTILYASNQTHLDLTNLVNNAASNRVVVTPGANVTVTTNSPAANVMQYTVSSSSIFGEAWFVWGSSNTLATNAAGVAYKAMQRSDVVLPATPNTNTYTTPTAGQYFGEVITAIPAGLTTIVPGDITTVSFAYLSENRTMVIEPEIYIRTNMIAPSFSELGEREIGVGSQITLNNTFQTVTISVPITTNVVLSATNYLVRKYRVVSVSGGTPNVLLVSQGQYPARVVFPVGSAAFVLKTGDTMSGNLTLPTVIATTSLIVTGSVISGNSQTSTVVNAQWNTLDNVSIGSVISGGVGNEINGTASDFATIGGGTQNSIVSGSDNSVISGGSGNEIHASGVNCFIAGGFLNVIDVGTYNSISGGTENQIAVGDFSAIGGGAFNMMTLPAASAGYSVIAGGEGNTINTHQSVISGGASNVLLHSASGFSTISGGLFNESSADFTSSMGGFQNTNSGDYSTILGGYSNRTEGTYSLAAGRSAHSMQSGSWTFKDSSATPLINNQANSLKASFSSGYYLGGGNVTLEGTIDYHLKSLANSNQVVVLDANTNFCATNVLVDVGITWSTNAWTTDAAAANPTNWDVNMGIGGQRLLMSTNVNITNVLGVADGLVKSKVLVIEGAANRTLRVPESWRTADGSRLYYVTNVGILSIQTFGTFYTNAVFKNFY